MFDWDPKTLYLDFEGFSDLDLPSEGVSNYIRSYTSGIHMAALGWNGFFWVWEPGDPTDVFDLAFRENYRIVAHNAEFEYSVLKFLGPKVGLTQCPDISQFDCTASRAALCSLPRKLDVLAKIMGFEKLDSSEFNYFFKQSTKHEKKAGDWKKFKRYALRDVKLNFHLDRVLPRMPAREHQLWAENIRINQRGFKVDRKAAFTIAKIRNSMGLDVSLMLHKLTGGRITTTNQRDRIIEYSREKGVLLPDLKADTVNQFLQMPLPKDVRTILEYRVLMGKSSLAKCQKLAMRTRYTGRAHDTLLYAGAHTGRFTGVKDQPHNLPRGEEPTFGSDAFKLAFRDFFADRLSEGDETWLRGMPRPLHVAASVVRHLVVASEDGFLYGADFSSIEGRGLAWIADAPRRLNVYLGDGKVYERIAAGIFGVPFEKIDTFQRMIGKVADLSLGYGGGHMAIFSMAAGYGLNIDALVENLPDGFTMQELKETQVWWDHAKRGEWRRQITLAQALGDVIKRRWRKANPEIVKFWKDVEERFKLACEGIPTELRQLSFDKQGKTVRITLPSGRKLHYYHARVTRQGKILFTGVYKGRWMTKNTYGGRLVENIVQAFCRDVLRDAILRVAPWAKIVLHIHDEVVVDEGPDFDVGRFKTDMEIVPPWAAGLPIDVGEIWKAKRYRKT